MLLLALTTAFAQTLQLQQSGPTLELAIGPGLAGRPAGFVLAGQASIGWWFGPYDDSYGLGRFNAIVLVNRIDWAPRSNTLRYTPLIEFRRGMDLFVLAPHYLIAAGPVFVGNQVGAAVRIGGGLKLRRSRRVGIIARLAGGVDWVGGQLMPAGSLTFGGGYSTPTRPLRYSAAGPR